MVKVAQLQVNAFAFDFGELTSGSVRPLVS